MKLIFIAAAGAMAVTVAFALVLKTLILAAALGALVLACKIGHLVWRVFR
ncbi:MAG: hypothetical protein ABFC56_06670 [Clostridiaceae bacterium]